MPTISVIIRDGLVQGVENLPQGFTIRILDYDVDAESIHPDRKGVKAIVQEFTAPPSTPSPPTRNTKLLREIISTVQHLIQYPATALALLEDYYHDELLVSAGSIEFVSTAAEELRLAITTPECAQVLDYIGFQALAGITIDQVEDAINTLFQDRFIEP